MRWGMGSFNSNQGIFLETKINLSFTKFKLPVLVFALSFQKNMMCYLSMVV